jgi:hypothetical protein
MTAYGDERNETHEMVRDGESVRVPVFLMDEVQRTVATDGFRLHDGMGNPAGHKRGYVFAGNVEHRQRAVDAYDERSAAMVLPAVSP